MQGGGYMELMSRVVCFLMIVILLLNPVFFFPSSFS